MEEEEEADGHLEHLEEIQARIHSYYYAKYDRFLPGEAQEPHPHPTGAGCRPMSPSSSVGCTTHTHTHTHTRLTDFPVEKTREHYHARALRASSPSWC
ncbi:hypothetical protein CB1_002272003 [Camelus ferus]|nr:hypothetical protein CB1_002272003 [Camelus ferus]